MQRKQIAHDSRSNRMLEFTLWMVTIPALFAAEEGKACHPGFLKSETSCFSTFAQVDDWYRGILTHCAISETLQIEWCFDEVMR